MLFIKKIATLCTALLLCSALICNTYASSAAINWFTARTEDNLQPVLPGQLGVIKNHNAVWIDESHGDESSEKVIYLTFDFGYENGNTEKILDTMLSRGVRATFFVLAHPLKKNTELVRRMFREGHVVANHTQSHKDMTECTSKEAFAAELNGLEELCKLSTGFDMAKFYRPPEGRFSAENLRFAEELGYRTVFWSLAYADWDNANQPDPQKAKNLLNTYLHNGAVILLHPTSATNAAILGELIDDWQAKGYRFETLNALPG